MKCVTSPNVAYRNTSSRPTYSTRAHQCHRRRPVRTNSQANTGPSMSVLPGDIELAAANGPSVPDLSASRGTKRSSSRLLLLLSLAQVLLVGLDLLGDIPAARDVRRLERRLR